MSDELGKCIYLEDIFWRKSYKAAALQKCPEILVSPNGIAKWCGQLADAMLAEDEAHEKGERNGN